MGGQVAHGATYGGIVTGVDYGHGVVSGVGAIGNRAVYAHAPAVHSYAAYPAVHHGAYYGKREAEADAYTLGQVAAGLPVHNAYATGHPHNVGVVTGVSTPLSYAHHVGYTGYAAPYYGKTVTTVTPLDNDH